MSNLDNDIAISLKNVTKTYTLYKNDRVRFKAIFFKNIKGKKSNAISDLSFDIKKGEMVALLGRNGAGKSTLLKMITGVTYPTSGEISIDGRVSALLELTAGFDGELSGRENIYFRASLMSMTNREIKDIEPDIVEFSELGEYIDQPVRTYSSGMKARLGFAINVNIDPEILIVDEALSVGDQSFKKKCTAKIHELVEDKNITFLFVTHSTKMAAEFCTRGIVMKKGKMIFDSDIESAIDFYDDMIEKEDEAKKKKKAKKREERLKAKKEVIG
ncbi:MAG: ABC transporter ATP-binding protein [Hornefia sp.]|nr:ABC transporter ATP-binding protein [Hornefia sp.]